MFIFSIAILSFYKKNLQIKAVIFFNNDKKTFMNYSFCYIWRQKSGNFMLDLRCADFSNFFLFFVDKPFKII